MQTLLTWRSELDVLVGIVQAGSDEGRHGAIHHDEVLVAVGLHPCHRAHQGTSCCYLHICWLSEYLSKHGHAELCTDPKQFGPCMQQDHCLEVR